MKHQLLCLSGLLIIACDGARVGPPSAVSDGYQPLSVKVVAGHAPVAGAQVLFHGANGQFVAQTETDASGTASREVTPGMQVTVAVEPTDFGAVPIVRTYTGVEPGDALEVDVGSRVRGERIGRLEVTLPAGTFDPSLVEIYIGCEAQPASMNEATTFVLSDKCLDSGGRINVLAQSMDPFDWTVDQYAYAVDVEVERDAVTTVSLTEWRTDWQAVPLDLEGHELNAPAGAQWSLIRGGLEYGLGYLDVLPGGDATMTVPPDFADDIFINIEVFDYSAPTGNIASNPCVMGSQTPSASSAYDLSDLIPAVTSLGVSDGTISWRGGADAGIDGVLIGIPPFFTQTDWWIMVGPNTDSYEIPDLGPQLGTRYTVEAYGDLPLMIARFDYDEGQDYRAARQRRLADIPGGTGIPMPATSAGSRVRLTFGQVY